MVMINCDVSWSVFGICHILSPRLVPFASDHFFSNLSLFFDITIVCRVFSLRRIADARQSWWTSRRIAQLMTVMRRNTANELLWNHMAMVNKQTSFHQYTPIISIVFYLSHSWRFDIIFSILASIFRRWFCLVDKWCLNTSYCSQHNCDMSMRLRELMNQCRHQ